MYTFQRRAAAAQISAHPHTYVGKKRTKKITAAGQSTGVRVHAAAAESRPGPVVDPQARHSLVSSPCVLCVANEIAKTAGTREASCKAKENGSCNVNYAFNYGAYAPS